MSTPSSPLGRGLYFIDVLACLLFCLTLALAGARFGRELAVEVELPRLEGDARSGSQLSAPEVAVRSAAGELEIFLEGERVTVEGLEEALRDEPPPSVVVRSEASGLTRVIAALHAAGVGDIQLAYEATTAEGATR